MMGTIVSVYIALFVVDQWLLFTGLIRWGIVIHGFIDGYSRLITGMRAHDNNRSPTVLSLFLSAAERYGIPSRVRGDHGVENIWVAAFMEHVRGTGQGSYIWGCSVHNVRIERLWVDVSHYVSQHWHDAFTALEVHHDLDVQNVNHIWLIHHLFLRQINDSLAFWAESWNSHRVRKNNGPSRSPEDRFGFDMFVQGFRGEALDQFAMSDEELEVFGIDWEGLEDEVLLRSLRKNYAHEDGTSTWLGRHGPPPNLNEVIVDPPSDLLTSEQLDALNMALRHIPRGSELGQIVDLWTNALAYVRTIYPGYF
ncbi:hypothetical protein HHX47_DHR7000552 [Lentinula edodes]|nr:hypothetical protein HHX47_DHR7000552 [Lentinula edodes]